MLLENEHIRLRAVEPEDLELLYRWENNPDYWHAGEVRAPYSRFALKQYILSSAGDIYENKQIRFMIESKKLNKTVGTIDLFDFDVFNSRIAVGLMVDGPYQHNGFASEAMGLVEEYVFDYLGINQIYAHAAETNAASRSLFESRGYENSAVLKNWIRRDDRFIHVLLFQLFARRAPG